MLVYIVQYEFRRNENHAIAWNEEIHLTTHTQTELTEVRAAIIGPEAIPGITKERMQSVPGGTHWGGGMHISSFDHARFGLMVHRGGMWGEQQLLPEGWVDALRTPSSVNDGYGFLWWLNTGHREWPGASESAYAAVGAGSNIILIDPRHDLILIARWIDQGAVNNLVAHVVDAIV